jgi:hypothetical protein
MRIDSLAFFNKIPNLLTKQKNKIKDSVIRMKPSTLVTAESIT